TSRYGVNTALGGKRRIQSLEILRREGYRKRRRVFLHVLGRAGFRNGDDASAAHHPGQCYRGGRATVTSADLRQRAVGNHQVVVAAERRVRHHRHVVPSAPRQHIALDAAPVETIGNLVGGAATA